MKSICPNSNESLANLAQSCSITIFCRVGPKLDFIGCNMPYSFCRVCFEYAYCKKCACGGDLYCSVNCQKQHWAVHKRYCLIDQVWRLLLELTREKLPREAYDLIISFWKPARHTNGGSTPPTPHPFQMDRDSDYVVPCQSCLTAQLAEAQSRGHASQPKRGATMRTSYWEIYGIL